MQKLKNAPKGIEGFEEIEVSKFNKASEVNTEIRAKINSGIESRKAIKTELTSKLTGKPSDAPITKQLEDIEKEIVELLRVKDIAKIDANWFQQAGNKIGKTGNSAKTGVSKVWNEQVIGDWENREIKSDVLNSNRWIDRQRIKSARRAGYLDQFDDIYDASKLIEEARPKIRISEKSSFKFPEQRKIIGVPSPVVKTTPIVSKAKVSTTSKPKFKKY